MQLNNYITARVENGAVTLGLATPRGCITLIGSSCQTGAPAASEYLTSVSLALVRNEDVVVALGVYIQDEKGRGIYSGKHLIRIHWEREVAKVDLQNLFVPRPDRLGQIQDTDDLTVVAEGQRFTFPFIHRHEREDAAKKEKLLAAGHRLVDDPNLLCRFLVGQASLEDLEAAATEDKRTQTERALAKAEAELTGHKSQLAETQEQLASATTRLENQAQEIIGWKQKWGETKNREIDAESAKSRALQNLGNLKNRITAILTNDHSDQTFWGFLPWAKLNKIRKLLTK